MSTPRRAFTLMEMLVIIMIIGVLTGLLLPVVAHARRAARAAECQNHLSACIQTMSQWLKDHEDIYPEKYTYESNEYYATAYGLLGEAGVGTNGDMTPRERRPLNAYTSDTNIARCPLDRGTREFPSTDYDSFDDNQGQMLVWEYQGSSYYYPARSDEAFSKNKWEVRNGMWMVGGHRGSQVEFPDRKLIFADAIVLPGLTGTNAIHFWHNSSEPLTVNVAYADGHVQDVARKTKDRFKGLTKDATQYDYDKYFDKNGQQGAAKTDIRALLEGVADPNKPDGPALEPSPYY